MGAGQHISCRPVYGTVRLASCSTSISYVSMALQPRPERESDDNRNGGSRLLVVRRGIGSGECCSGSFDLGEDVGGRDVPGERARVVVPVLGPGADGGLEFGD